MTNSSIAARDVDLRASMETRRCKGRVIGTSRNRIIVLPPPGIDSRRLRQNKTTAGKKCAIPKPPASNSPTAQPIAYGRPVVTRSESTGRWRTGRDRAEGPVSIPSQNDQHPVATFQRDCDVSLAALVVSSRRGGRKETSLPNGNEKRPCAFSYERKRIQSQIKNADAVTMETADDSVSQSSDEGLVLIRINVPDLGVQKCMQFHKEELVWDVKQQVLAALPKELKESFNYGLFCPPQNGKAGKFLDEERPLSNYPLPGPIGYLELKYKRRIYKMMNVDEKQIKQLHTRANLRRMLDYVQGGHVEKVSKLCTKGLDPNFHCPESGETPLTLAAGLKKSSRMLMALVNGGALLDYRTKDGCTAMHRAVEKNNHEAIQTLLDLGASPNYRDNKGLTPLYYTVLFTTDPHVCELLLHDHAHIGAQDFQGWQEVHQACRNGLVQHLEHLLFYSADMNARNASGNTPLHVCAVNDQESCARVLLFRGAEKEALNYANQTPYQVAVIAGNLALAEVIQKHRPEDVVLFREAPKFNPRRRLSNASTLRRVPSETHLDLPPSPSPSNRSLPPFSSASSLSETSTGSSSTCTHPSLEDSEDTAATDKSVTSDSSGVCTSNSANSYEQFRDHDREKPLSEAEVSSGMMCVCLEAYNSGLPDHLVLSPGDIVEVTAILDAGKLEGRTKTQHGFFPINCVQEVRLRNNSDSKMANTRVEGRREATIRSQNTVAKTRKIVEEPRTVILHKGKKGYGFVLRGAKGEWVSATSPLMEMQPSDNCPALQYLDDVDQGGVADLAGLKKGDYLLAINGEDVSQASHEHVVNLIRKSGDLVAMTVITVFPPGGALAEKPPNSVAMRQCSTLPRKLMRGKAAPTPPRRDPRTTLSVGRARARSMVAGLAGMEALNQTLQQQYETETRSGRSSSIESLPYKPGSPGDPQHPKTASIRARPASKRLTAAELGEILARQGPTDLIGTPGAPGAMRGVPVTIEVGAGEVPKVYGSVAEMKRCRAGRHKGTPPDPRLHKEFNSTPDLLVSSNIDAMLMAATGSNMNNNKRRAHSQENVAILNARNSRHSWAFPATTHSRFIDGRDLLHAWGSEDNLYEKSRSTDMATPTVETNTFVNSNMNNASPLSSTRTTNRHHDIIRLPPRGPPPPPTHPPPPPTHPPPPPPISQMVKVDVSRARSEYANVNVDALKPTVLSSFRPSPEGGKVYACPDGVSAAYAGCKITPPPSSVRSCSLPAKMPPPPPGSASNTSSESETSGDSTTGPDFNTFQKGSYPVAPDTISTDSGHSSERSHPTPNIISSTLTTSSQHVSPYAQPYRSLSPKDNVYKNGEPFIPDPDYDMSGEDEEEDDEHTPTPQNPPTIPPPPKIYEKALIQSPPPPPCNDSPKPPREIPNNLNAESALSNVSSESPHKDAKKAIVEARDRLRSVQRTGGDKNVGQFHEMEGGVAVGIERRGSTGSERAAHLERRDSAVYLETDSTGSTGSLDRPPAVTRAMREERRGSGDYPKKPPVPIPKQSKSTSQSSGASVTNTAISTCAPATPPKNEMGGSPNFKQLIAQKVAERQRRVTTPEAERAPPGLGDSGGINGGEEIDSAVETNVQINVREQISAFEKKRESGVGGRPSTTSPMRIPKREVERPRTRSQVLDSNDIAGSPQPMKISKSCPTDLSQEELDNSSSGVSSDVEGVPNDGIGKDELDSDDSDDPQDQSWSLRARLNEADLLLREEIITDSNAGNSSVQVGRRTLTKNAVSLVKLPPPIESGETDAESDIAELAGPSPTGRNPQRKLPKEQEGAVGMAAATTVLRPGTGPRSIANRPQDSGPPAPMVGPSPPPSSAPRQKSSSQPIRGNVENNQRQRLIENLPPESQKTQLPKQQSNNKSNLDHGLTVSNRSHSHHHTHHHSHHSGKQLSDGSVGTQKPAKEVPHHLAKHSSIVHGSRETEKIGSHDMSRPVAKVQEMYMEMKVGSPTSENSSNKIIPAFRAADMSYEAYHSPPSSGRQKVISHPTVTDPSKTSSPKLQRSDVGRTPRREHSHGPPVSRKKKDISTSEAVEIEKSIEQSLELIKMHVDSLHEVNVLAGLVPPPPEFEGSTEATVPEEVGMIAPPPEFSDDVHVPLADHLQELLLVSTLPRPSPSNATTASSATASQAASAGKLRNSKLTLKLGYMTPSPSVSGAASATSRLVRPKTLSTAATMPAAEANAPKVKPKLSPDGKTPSGIGGGSGAAITSATGVCNGSVESPTSKPGVGSGAGDGMAKTAMAIGLETKEFSSKPLQQWTTKDVSDWLESLFMPEYKGNFEAAGINGSRLATIDNSALLELGVRRVGHRLNMERSLRRHMSQK